MCVYAGYPADGSAPYTTFFDGTFGGYISLHTDPKGNGYFFEFEDEDRTAVPGCPFRAAEDSRPCEISITFL